MRQRERLVMLQTLALRGHSDCIRCGQHITMLDNFVLTKIDPLATQCLSNTRLRHKACAIVSLEKIVSILPNSTKCYYCHLDITKDISMMEFSSLVETIGVVKGKDNREYLIHISCVWKLKK